MRRATECFSMYSDMSVRSSALSSSNRYSANALVSSVLPTPVGPRNMNEPIGRRGPRRTARARRPAVCAPAAPVRTRAAAAGAPHRGGPRFDRLGLADHPLGEFVLHAQQLFLLA